MVRLWRCILLLRCRGVGGVSSFHGSAGDRGVQPEGTVREREEPVQGGPLLRSGLLHRHLVELVPRALLVVDTLRALEGLDVFGGGDCLAETVRTNEESVVGSAGEVPSSLDGAVVLACGFEELHSDPCAGGDMEWSLVPDDRRHCEKSTDTG